jgi:hypothetical protein
MNDLQNGSLTRSLPDKRERNRVGCGLLQLEVFTLYLFYLANIEYFQRVATEVWRGL